jgi:hypothetical protein
VQCDAVLLIFTVDINSLIVIVVVVACIELAVSLSV